MKKILVFAIFICLACNSIETYAQASMQFQPDMIEDYPDVYPEFPGGIDSLTAFLKRNFQYPSEELKSRTEGVTQVSFIVDTLGKLKEITIGVSSGNKNFDAEAIRLVKKMPNWKPALLNERKVEMYFALPILFKLR